MAIVWESKRPTEVRDYEIDWTQFLDGDTIATSDVTVVGITLDSDTNDTTSVSVTLSGGTEATLAKITNTITTAAGRTETEVFTVYISDFPEPVTLTEVKAQTNMADDDSQDVFLASLIAPARAYCERVSGFVYVRRELTATFRRWGDYLEIWRGPVVSIESVTYSVSDDPADDVEYTGFAADLNSKPVRIYAALGGNGFPEIVAGQTITVAYTAGFEDGSNAEEVLIGKRAMLLLIGHWFENRETAVIGQASSEVDFAVRSLLDELRPVSAY